MIVTCDRSICHHMGEEGGQADMPGGRLRGCCTACNQFLIGGWSGSLVVLFRKAGCWFGAWLVGGGVSLGGWVEVCAGFWFVLTAYSLMAAGVCR